MSSSSEPDSTPSALLLQFGDADILMTPAGSAIASGDGEPIILQSLN